MTSFYCEKLQTCTIAYLVTFWLHLSGISFVENFPFHQNYGITKCHKHTSKGTSFSIQFVTFHASRFWIARLKNIITRQLGALNFALSSFGRSENPSVAHKIKRSVIQNLCKLTWKEEQIFARAILNTMHTIYHNELVSSNFHFHMVHWNMLNYLVSQFTLFIFHCSCLEIWCMSL